MIHRHTGGLESSLSLNAAFRVIHRHTGGLEIADAQRTNED